MDIVYLLLTTFLFLAVVGLAHGCARLNRRRA